MTDEPDEPDDIIAQTDQYIATGRVQTPEDRSKAIADTKAAAEKSELRRAFLIRQMENPMFREWLMEQLIGFNTFSKVFGLGPTGFPDHAATEFQSGMSAAGWHLWEQIDTAAPDLASKMRKEFRERKA